MNATTTASTTASTATRPGRPTGFRLKFTITAGKVREGIEKGLLSGNERMTIVNKRQRSQEEIMALIMANPGKVTDPEFMASLTHEETESGMTLSEVVAEPMKGENEIEIARVDIASYYDNAKADALSFLSKNATRDES